MRAARVISALVGLILSAAAVTVSMAGPSQAADQTPSAPATVCPNSFWWDGTQCV
jgi:hypothetical protein